VKLGSNLIQGKSALEPLWQHAFLVGAILPGSSLLLTAACLVPRLEACSHVVLGDGLVRLLVYKFGLCFK
jgi:hypothetical protein